MKFKSDIEIQAGVEAGGSTGDSGQILSSTGLGVAWIDQNAITSASDFVFFNVKNETGLTILKGKGVMAVGTDGNSGHILVDEMVANGTVEAKYFLGVLEDDILNGGFARVISFGQLDQFNTSGQNGETWNDGQILWCDPANPGDFTITEPDGPNVKIAAAFILNSSTNGKIQIRVQANEGIHDLHDTKITSQVDGDVLVWDNTTGVWFNDSTLNVDYTNSKVGIGTTDPTARLHVEETTSIGPGVYPDVFKISGNSPTITIQDLSFYQFVTTNYKNSSGGTIASHVIQNNPGGSFYKTTFNLGQAEGSEYKQYQNGFDWRVNNDSKLIISNQTGYVGIGETNPSEKLTVSGNISATGTITGSNLSGTNTGDQDLSGYLTITGKAADSNLLDGIDSSSFLRSNTNDSFTGNLTTGANNHITFGPNSTWGSSLRIGGNGRTATGTEMASIVTTDGNIHLDAADSVNSIYLNYYAGTGGVIFGNGNDGIAARMDALGNLYKATSTSNVTATYWHSGNDGSGSGLDADLLDGQHASAFAPVSHTHTWASIPNNSVNGWGGLRHQTDSGYIDFGPANSNYAHIYTDRPSFYFNKSLIVSGGSTINSGDIRSAVFYDSGDTSYYLDPASTSNLNELDVKTIQRWYRAGGNAHQRVDARLDGSDQARMHWYGKNDSNSNVNFKHAWYDGSNYINVTAASSVVSFVNTSSGFTTVSSDGDFRAPIFYDLDNTDFYLDPASTSQVNHLHCSSLLSFGAFSAGVRGTLFEGYSTHSVVRTDSAQLRFFMGKSSTGVGTVMSITDTGRVGIGTTDPNETLGLYKSDRPYIQLTSSVTGTSSADGSFIGFASSSGFLEIRNKENQDIRLSTNDTERMRITSAGNVGIGTDDPGYKLDVNGSLHSTNLTIADYIYHEGDTNTYMQFHAADQWRVVTGGVERFEVNNSQAYASHSLRAPIFYDSNNTAYYLDPASTGTSATFAGNVGIGTTNPGAKLEVDGDVKISLDNQLTITRSGISSLSSDSCIYVDNTYTSFGNPNNIDSDISSQYGSRHIVFRYNGSIVGHIAASGTSGVSYNTSASDERLKKNIEDWQENILDKFEQIEPKKFNFIAEAEGEDKTKGFMAQKMVDNFPEAYPNDYSEEKYYSFNPSGMVVYLMKAVKELVEKNKELENRIQTLENK